MFCVKAQNSTRAKYDRSVMLHSGLELEFIKIAKALLLLLSVVVILALLFKRV